MRVPISWLYEHIDLGLTAEDLADRLTIGGLEVEAVHRPTAGTRGVRIVEVVEFAPVPKADKLSLVQAFDGERTWAIVCGAKNFAVGDRVPAALPGAVLPGGFEIGAKQLMGVTSNGMLASARELGVGEDHAGIWLLGPDAPLGADLTEWLDLEEAVLDIDLTPDRGYGASIWGLARDLRALTGAELRLPELAGNPGGDAGVGVTIQEGSGCRRWDGRGITGVGVAPSPPHVQKRLALAGMRPISNVVDATNYAMLETGYPVHAYDTALLLGDLTVRRAEDGETLTTLDGVVRTLDPEDVVIADESGPVGLAGVMGGEATEISEGTTELFVEVAAWDPVAVLRTARRHRLHTEARSRFERRVSSEWLPAGAARVNQLILIWAGGAVIGGHDHHPIPDKRPKIRLRPARVRSLLGVDLPGERQAALLTALGCKVSGEGEEERRVVPPPYRPDLLIEADLTEEVARLHGYDKIEPRVPSTGRAGRRAPADLAALAVRRALAGAGWTEALLYPFIADDDLAALGLGPDDPRRRTVQLVNPLSKEEAVLRTTLLPGLLATVRRNVNRQQGDLALFETGHVFIPPGPDLPVWDGGPADVVLPAEPDHLALVACGAWEGRRHDRSPRQVDFADLLGAVELIRRTAVAGPLRVERTEEMPFHPGRAARVFFGDTPVGVAGELHPRVCTAFEVPPRTVAAELRLDVLAGGAALPTAVTPSTLPGLRFDVAALVDEGADHATVSAAIAAAAGPSLTAIELFDVYQGEQLGAGRKSLAFSLVLDDPASQLTDVEEAAAIERIAGAVEGIGGALRR